MAILTSIMIAPAQAVDADATPALAAPVHVYQAPSGGYLVERRGTVNRISFDGRLDLGYSPMAMNIVGGGEHPFYAMVPQTDGRFVVVTTGQPGSGGGATNIAIRFYNSDGSRDVVRGGSSGERLIGPTDGIGAYRPTSAWTDTEGRILVGALAGQQGEEEESILIRLFPDGSRDGNFGRAGVVALGSQPGRPSSR